MKYNFPTCNSEKILRELNHSIHRLYKTLRYEQENRETLLEEREELFELRSWVESHLAFPIPPKDRRFFYKEDK